MAHDYAPLVSQYSDLMRDSKRRGRFARNSAPLIQSSFRMIPTFLGYPSLVATGVGAPPEDAGGDGGLLLLPEGHC